MGGSLGVERRKEKHKKLFSTSSVLQFIKHGEVRSGKQPTLLGLTASLNKRKNSFDL